MKYLLQCVKQSEIKIIIVSIVIVSIIVSLIDCRCKWVIPNIETKALGDSIINKTKMK